MKKRNYLFQSACVIAALSMVNSAGAANESSSAAAKILDKVMVIGNPANIEDMPGSARVVSKEEIRQQSYDDVNRVLRKVPGVYVREEGGFGLVPNISLRGVDTTRSAKVTIMEDGILMAPAPYSAPSAYYSPTVGRMSGLEVLKGSSQIKYGPHITGGVINYLSTPIPTKETVYLKSLMGNFGEMRTHAYIGNTIDMDAGKFGFLVEAYNRKNDGFKTMDETADFRNGSDTGFSKLDKTIKLSWEPNTAMYQRFEFKYGNTDLDNNQTYVGLSEVDFTADPLRIYSAARFDNLLTEQERIHLRYTVAPTDNLDIIATLYRNEFFRDWFKLGSLRNVNGVNGNNINISRAIAGADSGNGLACLKGDLACDLRVRANNRKMEAQGLDTLVYYRFGTDEVQHEIAAGIRFHTDQTARFQTDFDFAQVANGSISGVTQVGNAGDAGNRLQKTESIALFVQDTIKTGAWTITPGIRYEMLDQTYENPTGSLAGTNDMNMTAGGLGLAYKFNNAWTGYGGLHRGFSPPSPRAAINSGIKEETSTTLEAGARYSSQALAAEATVFHTAFENLIVINNIGGTGDGSSDNFGEVNAYGLELAAQYDLGVANRWSLSNPWYMNLTYTSATQQSAARTTNAGSIFSFGQKGNKMPYIPELVLNVGTSVEAQKWGGAISANYVSDAFTSASNTSLQLDGNGNPDARFGKTDSYLITDVTAFYRLSKTAKVFAGIQNLFDEQYLVSRQPHGPRPGMPQFFYVGIEMKL